jgi:hypothetical protein
VVVHKALRKLEAENDGELGMVYSGAWKGGEANKDHKYSLTTQSRHAVRGRAPSLAVGRKLRAGCALAFTLCRLGLSVCSVSVHTPAVDMGIRTKPFFITASLTTLCWVHSS